MAGWTMAFTLVGARAWMNHPRVSVRIASAKAAGCLAAESGIRAWSTPTQTGEFTPGSTSRTLRPSLCPAGHSGRPRSVCGRLGVEGRPGELVAHVRVRASSRAGVGSEADVADELGAVLIALETQVPAR